MKYDFRSNDDSRVVSVFSKDTGKYICRVYKVKDRWTAGATAPLCRSKTAAVDAYLKFKGAKFERAGDVIKRSLSVMRRMR